MRVLLSIVIALAALSAAEAAFASSVWSVSTYTASGCTGNLVTTSFFPFNICITSGATSTMYTNTNGVVTTTTYVSTSCTGTGTTSPTTYTNDQCISTTNGSQKYVVPASLSNLYSVTTYSDGGCGTVSAGPTYGIADGVCLSASGMSKFRFSGTSLQICTYTSSGCGGTESCNTLTNNQCVTIASTTSVKYEYNAASTALPSGLLLAGLLVVGFVSQKF
jgi:hypothetical protein